MCIAYSKLASVNANTASAVYTLMSKLVSFCIYVYIRVLCNILCFISNGRGIVVIDCQRAYGLTYMRDRQKLFFRVWYKSKYSMSTDDWVYIGLLLLAAVWSFGIGLLLGLLTVKLFV